MPGNNNYHLWIQYQTFDVTQLIQQKNNTIGVLLGDGWARNRFFCDSTPGYLRRCIKGRNSDNVVDRFEFLFELHLLYQDETTEIINSDGSWKCHKNHVLMSTIYEGEYQDANLIIKDWNLLECNETNWFQCTEIEEPLHQKLTSGFSLPVVVKEQIKPIKIIRNNKSEKIIDMDQNMASWVEMKIDAPQGFEILIEHCEILQKEMFLQRKHREGT